MRLRKVRDGEIDSSPKVESSQFREVSDTPSIKSNYLRTPVRVGETVWQLRCPGCGTWADIDDDQLHGRVSVWHDPGCGYHETTDWWTLLGLDRFDDEAAARNAYRNDWLITGGSGETP